MTTYTNADLAPTPAAARTWNVWHFASLWVGMSVCIPTYMLAAALVQAGMSWWQALLAILLGNAIVLVPMVINAHAGTRYGIPFPVYARASFGLDGAHVPALLRSLVACGWFGIQTWIGGLAIAEMMHVSNAAGFLIFWVINFYFVWYGTESIKWLETVSAPLLIVAGLALLWWAAAKVGGMGPMLAGSETLRGDKHTSFIPWVTAMVGFWATLALNIPDFSRFARSQKDQVAGQTLGLLTTMPLFAFIGVAVSSATVTLYGEAIWNPVDLITRMTGGQRNLVSIVALVVILVATLTTNIAANIVAPANSFANLSPQRISFRTGGVIAALLGIAILPWKLLDVYQTWLITYSGLLGAVGGVLVCDYLLVRRGVLAVDDLYRPGGAYWYSRGVNPAALAAFAVGVTVAMSGALVPGLRFLFDGAWFSASAVAFVVYWLLMKSKHSR